MDKQHPSRLRFNFGFLIEARLGTSRTIELDYPTIDVEDVTLSPLQGVIEVTRTSEGVYMAGTLHTVTAVACVRCLNDAYVPLTVTLGELLYYPPWSAPPGELVVGEDGYVDLAPLVRELALLEVPIQPICRPDCLGLCQVCGQNLNEADCGCEQEEIDPRLAVLKALLDED